MFTPNWSSPLLKLRRAGSAQDLRRQRAATAKGVVVVGLLLLLLLVAYEIALHLLHDLRIHLGYGK
jgi:hypothetical protein